MNFHFGLDFLAPKGLKTCTFKNVTNTCLLSNAWWIFERGNFWLLVETKSPFFCERF